MEDLMDLVYNLEKFEEYYNKLKNVKLQRFEALKDFASRIKEEVNKAELCYRNARKFNTWEVYGFFMNAVTFGLKKLLLSENCASIEEALEFMKQRN